MASRRSTPKFNDDYVLEHSAAMLPSPFAIAGHRKRQEPLIAIVAAFICLMATSLYISSYQAIDTSSFLKTHRSRQALELPSQSGLDIKSIKGVGPLLLEPTLELCKTQLTSYQLGHTPQHQTIPSIAWSQPSSDGSLNPPRQLEAIDCTTSTKVPEVHMQYAADPDEWLPMLASAHSALRNTQQPGRLRFHFTVPAWANEKELCQRLLQGLEENISPYICPLESLRAYTDKEVRSCLNSLRSPSIPGVSDDTCYCGSPQFHIVLFEPSHHDMPTSAAMGGHKNDRASLMAAVNWSRNYADQYLYPLGIDKLMYLDADTIVQADIIDLWNALDDGKVIGFTRSCRMTMSKLYNFENEYIQQTMEKNDCYINAGVYVVNLRAYAEGQYREKIAELIRAHQVERLWLQGVQQPSFVLALLPNATIVPRHWNSDALGYNPSKGRLSECTLKSGGILHWNGVYKPWNCKHPSGCYREYWERYASYFL